MDDTAVKYVLVWLTGVTLCGALSKLIIGDKPINTIGENGLIT
ncbi:hypothetical protein yrohd0001_19720 [Yersinia rohdei ATCC 43380]|nr:hypothetical protein yrohd0001_19720 [Yersinia rohdei ATCC 43380]